MSRPDGRRCPCACDRPGTGSRGTARGRQTGRRVRVAGDPVGGSRVRLDRPNPRGARPGRGGPGRAQPLGAAARPRTRAAERRAGGPCLRPCGVPRHGFARRTRRGRRGHARRASLGRRGRSRRTRASIWAPAGFGRSGPRRRRAERSCSSIRRPAGFETRCSTSTTSGTRSAIRSRPRSRRPT